MLYQIQLSNFKMILYINNAKSFSPIMAILKKLYKQKDYKV